MWEDETRIGAVVNTRRDAVAVTGRGSPSAEARTAQKHNTAAPEQSAAFWTRFNHLPGAYRRMFQRGCCASPWRRSGSSSSSCCCWYCSPRRFGSLTSTSTRARLSNYTSTTEKVDFLRETCLFVSCKFSKRSTGNKHLTIILWKLF